MTLAHAATADQTKLQHERLPPAQWSANVRAESLQIIGIDPRALGRRLVALALLKHDPVPEIPFGQVAEDARKVDIDRAPPQFLELASAPVLEVDIAQAVPVLIDNRQRIFIDQGDVRGVQTETQNI